MIFSLDFFVTVAFVLIQWRVNVLLLRLARKRTSGPSRTAASALIVALDLTLVAGFVASYSEVVSALGMAAGPAQALGAATLVYFAIAAAAISVHAVWSLISRQFLGEVDPRRRKVLQTVSNSLIAVPAAVLGYGAFIERFDFHVKEVDVPVPRLPADLEGLRILQLSDIHLSAFLSERDLERVIDAANETRAHIAVMTGDLISTTGDPLDACIRQIARLKSDTGIWGCLGNHERYAKVEDYTTQAAARLGVRFLRSQTEPLRFGNSVLNLAGIDYQSWSGRHYYLSGKRGLVRPGAVNVLLSHNPDVFPAAAHQGYNLLLAGHTHGGQISVEILDQAINPARFFTPYIYGLYCTPTASAYVTRGIGTIGLPVRLGAPPEISLLRLRKA